MKVCLNNDKTRREWLNNYHAWGIWFKIPQTEATWYRCYLPDGTEFAVEEYPEVTHHCGGIDYTTRTKHFYMIASGESFDGAIQTEGALLGEIHSLRGNVEMKCPDFLSEPTP